MYLLEWRILSCAVILPRQTFEGDLLLLKSVICFAKSSLSTFANENGVPQLQSISEVMLEHYLKNSLAASPSAPKAVFAALAQKREPVDLAIGSTLQFKDGRIDRGNAKEIFLGLVHGQYTGMCFALFLADC